MFQLTVSFMTVGPICNNKPIFKNRELLMSEQVTGKMQLAEIRIRLRREQLNVS